MHSSKTLKYRRPLMGLSAMFLSVIAWPAAAACNASDLPSLSACLAAIGNNDEISLQADLSCDGAQCCPEGVALLHVYGKSGVTIEGNGHSLARGGDAWAQCPALHIWNSSLIQVRNLIVQENASVTSPPCYQGAPCPSNIALLVQDSANIAMDRVEVYDAPSFAVATNGVDGFLFDRSKIHNAGLIGLFSGPNGNVASTGIIVDRSIFTANATNAVVFYDSADNRLSNSLLLGNHRHGMYYWCGPAGNQPCNGGQVYVPRGGATIVDNNVVGDGRCDNCATSPTLHHPVWAIEAGGYSGLSDAAQVVNGLEIKNNYFYNHATAAVFRNEHSILNAFYLTGNIAAGAGSLYMPYNPNDRCTLSGPGIVDKDKCAADANQPHESGNHSSSPYQLDRGGVADWKLYQLVANGFRYEARYATEQPQFLAAHQLALRPLSGVDGGGAIYRCWLSTPVNGVYHDYLSNDRNCEGGGSLDSIVGFSVGAGSPGAYPIYRCRNGYDHYVSTQSSCGGDTQEGLLGYARP
ncbi:right-handed parallel beta-helix repeat-containing protein [Lysobacter sp. CCNWLW3]|uniref:right-handed parallel beta-helix repeat-containing protein n=1 Tax=unclassified Lysobacter TaxID=2635362 RepID=UPI002FD36F39